MADWAVEYTDDFAAWWDGLTEDEQVAINAHVLVLEQLGPKLGYPRSSQIKGSKHGHMRELRVQVHGRPVRVLYAFDMRRCAVLLIGGEKTGLSDERFYAEYVPKADALYDAHLEALRIEGWFGNDPPKGR